MQKKIQLCPKHINDAKYIPLTEGVISNNDKCIICGESLANNDLDDKSKNYTKKVLQESNSINQINSMVNQNSNFKHVTYPSKWEKIAAFSFGVLFIISLLILAIYFPYPTAFQYEIFRIVLSLACSGVAAIVPGFFSIKTSITGLFIRSGGAIAVFVLVFFNNPAQLAISETNIYYKTLNEFKKENIQKKKLLSQKLSDLPSISSEERTIIEKELEILRSKMVNLEESFDKYKKSMVDVAKKQNRFRKYLSSDLIEQASDNLRRGDINLTEMILKKVINVADHEDAAEAAKLLGDLAKEEIDLMRAKQYYIKAIRLQPENLEYIRASKGIAEKIGNVQDVKIYQGIENIVLMKNLKRLVEKHGSKPVSESLDLKDLDHNVNDLLSKIGDNDKPEEEKIDQYVDLISDIKKFCSNIRKSQENISEYLNNIEDLVKELNNKINKSITNKSIDGSFQ